MAMTRRRWLLAGLTVLSSCTIACNPLTVPYFLLVGVDPKVEPECSLKDKAIDKEELKVVILASTPLEVRPEFIGVERELVSLLTAKLQAGFKQNKEKVRVASSSWVQRWLEEHPNWKSMELAEVGKQIGGDIIVDLEINRLSMYQEGSSNQLYHGRAEISVTVVDCRQPELEPLFRKEYSSTYPRSRGEIPISDISAQSFRLAFLSRVATDLSWLFTAHPTGDEYHCD
jgi:hypothetical protein